MSTEELQFLLVGHEEWRLYAAVHSTPSVVSSPALLSGILGPVPTEINYDNGRGNQGNRGYRNDKGGKGDGRVGFERSFYGEGSDNNGVVYPNQGSTGQG
ncbi:hypothetical protein CRG98_017063 [Punica granatum]|uniref:Uncharacterized protein n=1 Tax=Punica granatum TaxID=22663 RepID=A0A2I0K1X6_PUNGR|nr:hypothetical protein CRG98_017063 [Punica granatum]